MKTIRRFLCAGLVCASFFPQISHAQSSQGGSESDLEAMKHINPNNEYQKQIAEIVKFVDANASMAGAVGACLPEEEIDVEVCSNMILDHWSDITGSEVPHLKTQDNHTEKDIIRRAWNNQRDSSYRIASSHKEKCGDYIDAERSSPIGNFCIRSNLPDNPY